MSELSEAMETLRDKLGAVPEAYLDVPKTYLGGQLAWACRELNSSNARSHIEIFHRVYPATDISAAELIEQHRQAHRMGGINDHAVPHWHKGGTA